MHPGIRKKKMDGTCVQENECGPTGTATGREARVCRGRKGGGKGAAEPMPGKERGGGNIDLSGPGGENSEKAITAKEALYFVPKEKNVRIKKKKRPGWQKRGEGK